MEGLTIENHFLGTGSSDALIWQRFTDVDQVGLAACHSVKAQTVLLQAHIMTVQRMSEAAACLALISGASWMSWPQLESKLHRMEGSPLRKQRHPSWNR